METDHEREFLATFDSVQDFDKAFERKGSETGVFFPALRQTKVGELVWIRVSIKGINEPLYLEGKVLWRRIRAGGQAFPAGTFVGLVERERANLDAVLRFLRSGEQRQERRRSPRFPVHMPASYATSKGQFRCDTRNLSTGGAFLRCSGPLLSVGARFPVVLYTEGIDGKGTPLSVQVAWIDLFEDTKGMGVGFIRSQAGLKQVGQVVKRLEKELR